MHARVEVFSHVPPQLEADRGPDRTGPDPDPDRTGPDKA